MNRLPTLLSLLSPEADALLVTHKKNQHYLTGFEFDDGFVLVTREKSYLLTDFRYIEAAREETDPAFEVIMMPSDRKAMFRDLLSSNHVTTVAFEESHLSYADVGTYQKMLDGVRMIPSNSVIEQMRIRKDEDEIENIIKAQRIAEGAFEHILGFITPDRTEIEVALELEFFMRSHGAKAVSFDTIAVSGSASSRPHGVPRPVKLESGFLTMDFGALYNGYCSDMTRTVVVGKCTDEMRKVYDTVLEAQLAALDAYTLGKTGAELDSVARKIIYDAGYSGCFGHGLGHGVGMDIHEMPRVSPAGNEPMEIGHVVTCEPGIYLEGRFGVRIEDMVVFTKDGPINITQAPKSLIVID